MKSCKIASQKGVKLEGNFVSKSVVNLSIRYLSASEVSLLSKGLRFVPAVQNVDPVKMKTELAEYGRKLLLIRSFRNNGQSFVTDRFRPKSSFNPRNKDIIIETNLSFL